jgi:hypothetical protein
LEFASPVSYFDPPKLDRQAQGNCYQRLPRIVLQYFNVDRGSHSELHVHAINFRYWCACIYFLFNQAIAENLLGGQWWFHQVDAYCITIPHTFLIDCSFCNLLLEIVYVTICLQNLFTFRNNTQLHTFVFLQNVCIHLIHFEKFTNEWTSLDLNTTFNIFVLARASVTCEESILILPRITKNNYHILNETYNVFLMHVYKNRYSYYFALNNFFKKINDYQTAHLIYQSHLSKGSSNFSSALHLSASKRKCITYVLNLHVEPTMLLVFHLISIPNNTFQSS